MGVEAHHLTVGVHAGVGPTGGGDRHRVAQHPPQRRGQRAGDGGDSDVLGEP